jgi:hypothetical protein
MAVISDLVDGVEEVGFERAIAPVWNVRRLFCLGRPALPS